MSSSRSNPSTKRIYDVFLSYCVNDSAKSFAPRLYSGLTEAGINVFRDQYYKLRSGDGDQITPSVLHAIGVSRISIIIFSKDYAASEWCMQELVKIMDCHRAMSQRVIPVFYGVEPSDVRRTIPRISATNDKLLSWTRALYEACNISGFPLAGSRIGSGDINNVVQKVTSLLFKSVHIASPEHPVGVESRVQDVIRLLNSHQTERPLLLGIWGMAGIGKTIIAKDVYNRIRRDFDDNSFLLNVQLVSRRCSAAASLRLLQLELLSNFCMPSKTKITESGKWDIIEGLKDRKVLVILDDVRESEQLDALCGSREWFGAGSVIIITTRDKGLLMRHGVELDLVYRMIELHQRDSLELFCWHAFQQPSPKEDFEGSCIKFAANFGGLPGALKAMGAYVHGSAKEMWWDLLQKRKSILIPQIQHLLDSVLFDLSNIEKQVFLDISCFYIGMDQDDVIAMWSSRAETAIRFLQDNCIVTIDENNQFGMHPLLKRMGREIKRDELQKVDQVRIVEY